MDQLADLVDVRMLATSALAFAPRILVAFAVLFGFWLLYRLTRPVVAGTLRRSGLENTFVTLLVDRIYRGAMMIFGVVMAAGQVGIDVAAALAGIGIAGVAVGFAAQDLLANMIAGFVIMSDKPFKVGDFITVDDQYGSVTDITLRSTRIRTNRNTYVVLPNRSIIDTMLINHTKNGETRVDVPLGIAYKEDIPTARKVLLEAVKGLDGVLETPAPAVAVVALGNSSVDLQVRVWIHGTANEVPISSNVLETSKLALDAAGIQIPFPHLQLFVDDVQERVVEKIRR